MALFIFEAHGATPIYGKGDANSAARLANYMNDQKAINRWQVREVKGKAGSPLLDIAAEIARHQAARAA